MTAPCEKPPSTRPLRGDARVAHRPRRAIRGELVRLGEGLGVRVADLVDRVPVGATGRQVQRAARRHAQQSAGRVEMVEEREQVALVGAATVEEHEQPFRTPPPAGRASCVQRSPRARPAGRYLTEAPLPCRSSRSSSAVPAVHEVGVRCEPPGRDLRAARHGRVEHDEDDRGQRAPGATRDRPRDAYFMCCRGPRCRGAGRPSSSGTSPGVAHRVARAGRDGGVARSPAHPAAAPRDDALGLTAACARELPASITRPFGGAEIRSCERFT